MLLLLSFQTAIRNYERYCEYNQSPLLFFLLCDMDLRILRVTLQGTVSNKAFVLSFP